MYYIYQRISTQHQSLIRQQGLVDDYCTKNNIVVPEENVYSDIITGKTIKREFYQKMKAKLQKDDILIVQSLDRLGRNWDLIKSEWQELTKMGVYIIVIDCPLINALPDQQGQVSIDRRLIQEMMFSLLCYVSQREVEKISERTRDAIRAKRESDPDFKIGKPRVYDDEFRARVVAEYQKGKKSMDEVAEQFGVSKTAVFKFVKESR